MGGVGGWQSGCLGTAACFVYNPVTGAFLAIKTKDMFLKTQKLKFTSRHQCVWTGSPAPLHHGSKLRLRP